MDDERLAALHALTFEPRKDRWRLRITVSRGPKMVGKRLLIDLPGFTEEQAIEAKRVALAALALVGLQAVKSRPIRRMGNYARSTADSGGAMLPG